MDHDEATANIQSLAALRGWVQLYRPQQPGEGNKVINEEDLPKGLKEELLSDYRKSSVKFKQQCGSYGWELIEVGDDPDSEAYWLVVIDTTQGQLVIYADAKVFSQLGEELISFERLSATAWGRLFLKACALLSRIRRAVKGS